MYDVECQSFPLNHWSNLKQNFHEVSYFGTANGNEGDTDIVFQLC
jgi:hypothetical protein